jgi:hypothetical protein
VRYSITVRLQPGLRQAIEAIPEADWTAIPYPESTDDFAKVI